MKYLFSSVMCCCGDKSPEYSRATHRPLEEETTGTFFGFLPYSMNSLLKFGCDNIIQVLLQIINVTKLVMQSMSAIVHCTRFSMNQCTTSLFWSYKQGRSKSINYSTMLTRPRDWTLRERKGNLKRCVARYGALFDLCIFIS
jgi:hypothetical protein